MIRVLLVDDERMARYRLRVTLEARPTVRVVGECADGADAVEAIRELDPELLFLDVQMPELDGFEVVRTVGVARMPLTVFVTAHDQYALRAFDVNALDYLLKPFDDQRLLATLERAEARLGLHRRAEQRAQLAGLLAGLPAVVPLDRLLVKVDGQQLVVPVPEIDWAEAADNYVEIHVGPALHLVRGKLSALATRLDPRRFARVHRSTIVNVERVRALETGPHGDVTLVLTTGVRLAVGRAYRAELLGRFEGFDG